MTIRTWPATGVVSLDILLCDSSADKPALVVLDTVKHLFGGQHVLADVNANNNVVWSIKKRGFRPEGFDLTDLQDELETPGGPVKEVVSTHIGKKPNHVSVVLSISCY